MTQEKFFEKEMERIRNCENSIKLFGYDEPFMSRKEYIHALKDAASKSIKIEMFASTSDNLGKLEKLAKTRDVAIKKLDNDIKKGYKLFDTTLSVWDSTKRTPYEPEKETVYLREVVGCWVSWIHYDTVWLGKHLGKKFDKAWNKSVYQN